MKSEVRGLNVEEQNKLYSILLDYRTVFKPQPAVTHIYDYKIHLHDKSCFVKRSYPIPIALRPEVDI